MAVGRREATEPNSRRCRQGQTSKKKKKNQFGCAAAPVRDWAGGPAEEAGVY